MWVAGISPLSVIEAYLAAFAALFFFAVPASLQQQRHSPIVNKAYGALSLDWMRVAIVVAMLVAVVAANVITNLYLPQLLGRVPVLGLALWLVVLAAAPLRRPDWRVLPEAVKGATFLMALVTAASMMPVDKLPVASWQTTLGLGFVSSVFDNIPLTALALKQGGYDWGYLAYAVGFGRLADLVRLVGGCRPIEPISRGKIGRQVAPLWLACWNSLCDRIFRDADPSGLASGMTLAALQ